jgi:hypothetical protein
MFGRHTPFDPSAMNNLTSIPTNNAVAKNPITLDELKCALKKAKTRKHQDPTGSSSSNTRYSMMRILPSF